MILSCECGAKLKIDEAKLAGKRVKVRCPRCGNVLPLPSAPIPTPAPAPAAPKPAPSVKGKPAHLVLIAHDSEVVRNMVTSVLFEAGFDVAEAADGVTALKIATERKPQAIVVDVGLPGIYGFELCERLKNDPQTKGVKIILLSSVYDSRRYKRTPASLYGADDYIEKHHIPDYLTVKLRRLISPESHVEPAPKAKDLFQPDLPEMSRPPAREFESSLLSHDAPAPAPEREAAGPRPQRGAAQRAAAPEPAESTAVMPESISLDGSIFQKEECDIPRVDEADPDAVEKARRFARIIVSDVALYNQETVIEGIKNGTFFELLKADIDEGRELYEKRVPAVIKKKKDYYQEAFDNFIAAAKRKNVR